MAITLQRRWTAPLAAALLALATLSILLYLGFRAAPAPPAKAPLAGDTSASPEAAPAAPRVTVRPVTPPRRAADPFEIDRDPDTPSPVFVPLAGVAKWWAPLHYNAPGRMPAKEAVREPGGDALPPEPLAYAGTLAPPVPELVAWLRAWEADLAAGHDASAESLSRLKDILSRSSLTAPQLYELGRGVAFLSSGTAVPFYRLVVLRGVAALRAAAEGPAQEQTLHALRMVGRNLLQDNRQLDLCVPLYEALARHEPPGTFAARRALHLWAESLYNVKRFDEAVLLVQRELAAIDAARSAATGPEATALATESADAHVLAGYILYHANRQAEALEHLRIGATTPDQYFTRDAHRLYILALAAAGQAAEAETQLTRYRRQYQPAFAEAIDLATAVERTKVRQGSSQLPQGVAHE